MAAAINPMLMANKFGIDGSKFNFKRLALINLGLQIRPLEIKRNTVDYRCRVVKVKPVVHIHGTNLTAIRLPA